MYLDADTLNKLKKIKNVGKKIFTFSFLVVDLNNITFHLLYGMVLNKAAYYNKVPDSQLKGLWVEQPIKTYLRLSFFECHHFFIISVPQYVKLKILKKYISFFLKAYKPFYYIKKFSFLCNSLNLISRLNFQK